MSFLNLKDTISGQAGKAYATIDEQVEEMFHAKNIEAISKKNKTQGKTLGKIGTQSKSNGYEGTGKMNLYYGSPTFRRMMYKYMKTGVDTYFDLQIINDDPTSSVGKQTVVLKNVNLDSAVMAKFDVDSEMLDEDVEFTFDDADILDEFGRPVIQ
ncbi:hypothetical protein J2Z32_003469 [Paenibacillus turicensis]|uniref:Phage portal protein n=1 Tax=Paenibacillus turicensis TaxID=160487 RepID=A0ABS4FWA6_9BACL|nr:phage tail tube protein [Paenibacillus turicensis]MBP1906805.1 hypothetical protein [Paenibacillus turicensis]